MTARAGCPGGIAQPGFYAAAISLGNNATCTFQSGIYYLAHGISLGNNATVTSAAGGVLLYMPNEPLSVGNNTSITLSAMTTGYTRASRCGRTHRAPSLSPTTASSSSTERSTHRTRSSLQQQRGVADDHRGDRPGRQLQQQRDRQLRTGTEGAGHRREHPAGLDAGRAVRPLQTTASGGFGTYTYGLSGVPGLTIDPSTGVISGAPTQTGIKTLKLTLDDSFGDTQAVATFPITINGAMSITTASPLPAGNKNVGVQPDVREDRRDRGLHLVGQRRNAARRFDPRRQHRDPLGHADPSRGLQLHDHGDRRGRGNRVRRLSRSRLANRRRSRRSTPTASRVIATPKPSPLPARTSRTDSHFRSAQA